jgi:hypothetical protein
MKLQMFAKMPWCYWVTLPKYSSLHSISWIIHLTLLKRLLQDFSQVTLYHYVHWNNVWGALMMTRLCSAFVALIGRFFEPCD